MPLDDPREAPLSVTRFGLQLLLGLLLFFGARYGGQWISAEYAKLEQVVREEVQSGYYGLSTLPELRTREVLLWAELGRDQAHAQYLLQREGFDLGFESFAPGLAWDRDVFWSMRAEHGGALTLRFPPGRAAAVALYLTDGDTYWRSSEIVSGGTKVFAEDLHDGRWYFFGIDPEEKQLGAKEIRFRKLSGRDVAISAVVIFN